MADNDTPKDVLHAAEIRVADGSGKGGISITVRGGVPAIVLQDGSGASLVLSVAGGGPSITIMDTNRKERAALLLDGDDSVKLVLYDEGSAPATTLAGRSEGGGLALFHCGRRVGNFVSGSNGITVETVRSNGEIVQQEL